MDAMIWHILDERKFFLIPYETCLTAATGSRLYRAIFLPTVPSGVFVCKTYCHEDSKELSFSTKYMLYLSILHLYQTACFSHKYNFRRRHLPCLPNIEEKGVIRIVGRTQVLPYQDLRFQIPAHLMPRIAEDDHGFLTLEKFIECRRLLIPRSLV